MRSVSSDKSQTLFRTRLVALVLLLGAVCCICAMSCAKDRSSKEKWHVERFYSLGTLCVIRSDIPDNSDIEKMVHEEEEAYSAFIPNSFVSRINESAGIAGVEVSAEFIGMIKKSIMLSKETGGAFNVMIGCASSLYRNEYGEFCKVPDGKSLDDLVESGCLDPEDLVIDEIAGTVMLRRKGERIDLGGIAKGMIIDKVAEMLIRKGSKRFLINFGGDIRVFGDREYVIGIRDPESDSGGVSETVRIAGKCIVTSGAYERNFEENGVFYHHIIDPKTCRPCAIRNKSVTVIHDDAVIADALATALFINPDLRDSLIRKFEGLEVIFI